MSILDEIVDTKKRRLKETKVLLPFSEVKARALDRRPTRSFLSAIRRKRNERIRFIGELKKASPSKGLLREDFVPLEIASLYQQKGASAVSVITEEDYFQGSIQYLRDVSRILKISVLRKDFIFDDYQIYETSAFGADAVLLIAAILSRTQAEELYHLASEIGLDVLFEVHHWKELDMVLLVDPPIIGINNRDLKTLEVDVNRTLELLKDIPEDKVIVSESGISTRKDVELFQSTRVDALLIGTVFMKADSIENKIEELFGSS
jgi:indole-3-glycerol phosphate synthase